MVVIPITTSVPRDLTALGRHARLSKGTGSSVLFAVLLALLSVMLLVSFYFPPYDGGLIAFKITAMLVCAGISALLFRGRKKKIRSRKTAFMLGTPLIATVSEHGRSMNPARSRFNYTATLTFTDEKGRLRNRRIVSPGEDLWMFLPVQKKVILLYHGETKSLFVAEMFGCTLELR